MIGTDLPAADHIAIINTGNEPLAFCVADYEQVPLSEEQENRNQFYCPAFGSIVLDGVQISNKATLYVRTAVRGLEMTKGEVFIFMYSGPRY